MSVNAINPYTLLGVDKNSSLEDLKKQYYIFSLMCHPEKGGNIEDMLTVNNAYNYIKLHINNKNNNNLEQEFSLFCNKQNNKLLPFSKVYEESHDWVTKFNKEFEFNKNNFSLSHTDINNLFINPNTTIKEDYQQFSQIKNNLDPDLSDIVSKDNKNKTKDFCNCSKCLRDKMPWTMQNI